MKKSFLLMLILLLWMGVNSQTILYQDNFDSYTVESYLAQDNPTWWTTWENLPGTAQDAKIKNTYGHSPTQSFIVTTTTGNTDLILKLGDRTSGSYELSWWMYIDSPNAAYYNVQHFQSPGNQWAFETYFRVNGTGSLQVGGDSVAFTYPKATWFQLRQVFNLDLDSARLYVNGTLVSQWPFHYQNSGTVGANQLGGVDFFSENTTSTYYVDDLLFTQLTAPTIPSIVVSPDSITNWIIQGNNQSGNLMISDTGSGALHYRISVIYDSIQDLGLNDTVDSLHYDSDNTSAIGWNTVPTTITVAARFLNEMTVRDAGMRITSVSVYINDVNTTGSNLMTLKIWGGGSDIGPDTLLYQQDFTPAGFGWEHIALTTPVFVSGEELWVGYTFTQSETGLFIPGVDGGPANPNGDFLSTGVGWTHLSSNPTLDYNWNIRATLTGPRIPHWIMAVPDTGTVDPMGTDTIMITLQNDSLTPGRYTANLLISSDDPNNMEYYVPVILDVYGVGTGNTSVQSVGVYPNPVSQYLNIRSNELVSDILIYDLEGRIVHKTSGKQVNVSQLSPGAYLMKVKTPSGFSTIRFIKN